MSDDKFTALLVLLVPAVVAHIVKNDGFNEREATQAFYSSKVYALLEDEGTKLWHFSPLVLSAIFDAEQKTGKLLFPEGA